MQYDPLVLLAHFLKCTPKRFAAALKVLESSDAFFELDNITLQKQLPWPPHIITEFIQWRTNLNPEIIINTLATHDIIAISRNNPAYPPQLLDLYDTPLCIFVRGKTPIQSIHNLAVVGTRNATVYGKTQCQKIISHLAHTHTAIISGLAYGIDTVAHQTALSHNLYTIAVLGGGIDTTSITPRSNTYLAQTIIEKNGTLLSEFPPGTPPTKYTFPLRNRIIAALASHTLVIEAPKKSGALITAAVALEIGRDIAALPHPITSTRGLGTNLLLQDGAFLIANSADILTFIGSEKLTNKETHVKLTDIELKIMNVLDENLQVDSIVARLQLPKNTIVSHLQILILQGLVTKNGTYYCKA